MVWYACCGLVLSLFWNQRIGFAVLLLLRSHFGFYVGSLKEKERRGRELSAWDIHRERFISKLIDARYLSSEGRYSI
jgi:hypothetical protein